LVRRVRQEDFSKELNIQSPFLLEIKPNRIKFETIWDNFDFMSIELYNIFTLKIGWDGEKTYIDFKIEEVGDNGYSGRCVYIGRDTFKGKHIIDVEYNPGEKEIIFYVTTPFFISVDDMSNEISDMVYEGEIEWGGEEVNIILKVKMEENRHFKNSQKFT